ncbi:MAG: Dihydroorotase [Alphaproteobacteria bacterium MarineAlpha5_Bin11]|nr:dihydroorotase [Pelagibacteraceae bacterium]PPR42766.1 MAG: Dihydroorotase [Alphaproteobacteria bacterium MarineAlpha5_Bin11]PPR51568.1 MAG: Dihydroorotase [Alphaproteobacteria bacterium MarineAlpha5_Bin10]|tara:strand:+ start:1948 stop:2994 length:1047 start_codon:yes stop_codon:yes gene_type:complete
MSNTFQISITRPDDWHVHLRENKMLETVYKDSSRVFGRCIAMPNLKVPITNSRVAIEYKKQILLLSQPQKFEVYVPCYLTDEMDLEDFLIGIKNKYFFGAKLYPTNTTTNSAYGVTKIEKIFPALEILENHNAPLLIHGERTGDAIDIFDREKYFIDTELKKIINKFQNLKIVLEHVSSAYGAEFIADGKDNLAATVTLHHLMLTKEDVFNGGINPHHFCMPVVKNKEDLKILRKYACSGNSKFFLGTDSAPHPITDKENVDDIKPGIYSSPVAIELYASIFEEERSLENLEKFASFNGSNFYNLPYNDGKITLRKEEWINPEFTSNKDVKIKNFMGGQKIKWKVVSN